MRKKKLNQSLLKKMKLLMAFIFLSAFVVQAQVTEHFSDETDGAKVFSNSELTFNINSSYLHIEYYSNYGWTGSSVDNHYVDNSGSLMLSAGIVGSFVSTNGTFKVRDLYLLPSNDGVYQSCNGTIIIRGKSGATTAFTHTVLGADINCTNGTNNFFTYVNLSAYNGYTIDNLEFELTGSLIYLAIDAFRFDAFTNSAPTDIALSATSINENVAGNSTVGTLSTTDSDAGDTHTYSLVSGTGSTDNGAFNIDGTNLRITNSPDYEVQNSYSILVRSTDQGGLYFEKQFTITVNNINPPTINDISPTNGPAAGGTSLTITGVNFTGATAVSFGATAASSFTVNSDTEISTTSPAGSGSVNVTVTTVEGTSAGTSFTYNSPSISSISPTSGSAAGGTPVTITGLNLTGVTAVSFDAVAAADFTLNSDTEITATSPAGSGTVYLTVTSAGGTSASGASNQFTYLVAPTVTTTAISTFGETSATLGGNVTDDGGTTVTGRGVVYSKTSENANPAIGGTGVTQDTNGSGTGSFSESVTGLTPNTGYSVKAYAINNEGTSYGSVQTFTTNAAEASTFSGPGNWSDAGNWSAGIPGSITNVTVSSDTLTVNDDYECADMTINSGAVVTIDPGNILTVSGILTNSAGTAGLVLESDATGTGMVMNNSTGVQATVEQYLVKDQWHYMGIPVTSVADVNTVYHNCYVAWIDESDAEHNSDGGWTYMTSGEPLLSLHGYAVQYNRAGSDNDTIITFTGTLNTGIIDTTFTSDNLGWNFISNPYPVTLDWDASGGKTLSNANDAIYVWNPNLDSGSGDYGSYGSYVSGGSTNGQSRYIAPMQGFFIRVLATPVALSFNNMAKAATPVAFKSAFIEPQIRLSVTDNGINYDEMLLRVKDGSSINFDGNFDASKMKAEYSKQPLLYSVMGGMDYSINTIPEINEGVDIPLEIMVKTTGEHKLVLKELENYNYALPLNLFNEAGELLVNLETQDYIFSASEGEIIQLNLVFGNTLVSVDDHALSNVFISSSNNEIVLNRMGNIPGRVIISNVGGQLVYDKIVTAHKHSVTVPRRGLYFVTIKPEKGLSFNGKVVVNF